MQHRRLALTLAVLLAACRAGEDVPPEAPPLAMVRDSAGITIVENRLPAPGELPVWRLDPTPLLNLGTVAGDPGLEFMRVDEAVRLSDGRIVVMDGRARNVRVFGSEGSFERWIGRQGEGPGEFLGVALVGILPGDTIVISDASLRRVSRFMPDGEFLGSFRVEGQDYLFPMPMSLFRDGTMVARTYQLELSEDDADNLFQRLPIRYLGMDAGGGVASDFGPHPGTEMEVGLERWPDGRIAISGQRPIPFARGQASAASWDRFFLGNSDAWEFMMFDPDGTLTHLVRLDRDVRPVTGEAKDALLESRLAGVDPARAPAVRAQTRDAYYPETMPAYRGFRADALGWLWAQEYRPPWEGTPTWTIFDPEGVVSAEFTPPPGLRITDVGADYVVGVQEDDLGVQYVQLFRLHRGSEAASP